MRQPIRGSEARRIWNDRGLEGEGFPVVALGVRRRDGVEDHLAQPGLGRGEGQGLPCGLRNYLGSGSLLVKRVGAVANALADAEVRPSAGRAA